MNKILPTTSRDIFKGYMIRRRADMEEEKVIKRFTVTDAIGEIEEQICDGYCKYRHNPNYTQEKLDEICDKCPLINL